MMPGSTKRIMLQGVDTPRGGRAVKGCQVSLDFSGWPWSARSGRELTRPAPGAFCHQENGANGRPINRGNRAATTAAPAQIRICMISMDHGDRVVDAVSIGLEPFA